MADFPSIVTYATVRGQFLKAVVDSNDSGIVVDSAPVQGTVTFRADIERQNVTGASPNPFGLYPLEQTYSLNENGYLVSPNGELGATLIASDTPGNPTDFTYTVTYSFFGVPEFSFSIFLPTGSDLDLTLATPVDASGGLLVTTDELMTYIFNDLDSSFRAAILGNLTEIVTPLVPPIVVEVLANYPEIVAAAVALVNSNAGIVIAREENIPRAPFFVFLDAARQGYFWPDPSGQLHAPRGVETPSMGMTIADPKGHEGGMFYPEFRRFAQNNVGPDGKFFASTVADIGRRLGISSTGSSLKLDAHVLTGTGGGSGTGMTNTSTAVIARVPFRPFCDYAAGYWVVLANVNIREAIAYGSVSITGVWIGRHDKTNGEVTGKFTGDQVQLKGAVALPSDGSDYKFWVPAGTYDMKSGGEYVISYAYNSPAGQTNHSGPSTAMLGTDPAQVGVTAPTGLTQSIYAPLHVRIDPMIPTSVRTIMVPGDSIALGTNTSRPIYDAYMTKVALANGQFLRLVALHGSTAQSWVASTTRRWTEYDHLPAPDVIYIQVKSNDIFNGTSATSTLGFLTQLANLCRSKFATDRIYTDTCLPRNGSATNATVEAERKSLNVLLRDLPAGFLAAFEIARPVETTDGQMVADYMSGDLIHPRTAGGNYFFQLVSHPMI